MRVASLIIQLLTVSIISLRRQQIHNRLNNRQNWLNNYDYIVIGSGAAGAVVANRLTEDPNVYVLLLEAGPQQSVVTDAPGNANALVGSVYDWNYRTVPQKTFTVTDMPMARGKVIGGSTSINGMVYNRGHRREFDNWALTYGAKGWTYREVLPYFIKFENNSDFNIINQNPGYHGTNGPIGVSSDPNPDPILTLHQKALNELGVESTDINGRQQLGTMLCQSYIKEGIRSGVGNAYLDPNPHPDNLHIVTNAFVTKILFNRINDKYIAIGVLFVRNGKTYTVSASKEVIVSAGVFNSAQLLMLSGIGPKKHLIQMGIPVIADLPVGNNLQDHPAASIHMLIKDQSYVNRGPQMTVQQLYELYTNRSGPLSRNTFSVTHFSTRSNPYPDWPNSYFYSKVWFNHDLEISINEMPSQLNEWREYFRPYLGQYFLLSAPHLYKVRSYGTVRLRSTDPFDYPLIDPKFLANPLDYEEFVEITRTVLHFLEKSSISGLISRFAKPIPGCSYCSDRPLYQCDSYIMCLISKTGKTGYHPIGTCRMGSLNRTDVVVDERLRVKNIYSLRVIDSSVMPELINANTNAATIMIGEKGADLIKEDNKIGQ